MIKNQYKMHSARGAYSPGYYLNIRQLKITSKLLQDIYKKVLLFYKKYIEKILLLVYICIPHK
jgi:hypothetical protein